jgi:hypothetical protein
MAKRTNGGTTKTTSGETKATTTETKARRAPARRRSDKTTDAPVSVAAELAQPDRIEQLQVPASTAAVDAVYTPSPEEVRRRAFEIYCGRGRMNGSDLEDWLEAERQLRQHTH